RAGLATAALVGLLLLVVAGVLAWTLGERAARSVFLAEKVAHAMTEARQRLKEGSLYEAKTAAKRATDLLEAGAGDAEVHAQVGRLRKDLEMAEGLQEIYLEQADVNATKFDIAGGDPKFAAAFRKYGIDVETLDPAEVVARIGASDIKAE